MPVNAWLRAAASSDAQRSNSSAGPVSSLIAPMIADLRAERCCHRRSRWRGVYAPLVALGGNADWERRLAELWASIDDLGEEPFLARMEELAAELPSDSAVAAFERAASLDSTGHSDRAAPLYRQALEAGLHGERRRRAVIQLASSLRNVGQAEESVALLTAERDAGSDHLDDAVSAFLALALVDVGRERDAVALALTALAPHLPRYQRSLANYAQGLSDHPSA